MAYRFFIAGIEVHCDTLDELLEAVGAKVADSSPQATGNDLKISQKAEATVVKAKKPRKGTQGNGPKRAWQEAKEYAEKHGMTSMEARAILARKRKEAVEKALEDLEGEN